MKIGVSLQRRLRRIVSRGRYWLYFVSAWVWRRLQWRTTVVAITGSAGKTTATACLARILEAHAPTHRTRDNDNGLHGVLRTVLKMRPWHRFAVIEVGTDQPGHIARQGRLVRPHVAVVLCVGEAHMSAFRNLDEIAREKGQLVRHMRRGGVAVLNLDDARVVAMAGQSRGSVFGFGAGPHADLRVTRAEADWPERLTLTVEALCGQAGSDSDGGPAEVRTRLVGRHWSPAVAAALAAARVCGIPLATAAAALADMAPARGRMDPVWLPCGAVLIRDEGVASPESVGPVFELLARARAGRRIVVMSDLTASLENPRKRLRALGRQAAVCCDLAIFVGSHAHHAVAGARAQGMDPDRCHDLVSVRDAAERLREVAREGDLVLLKGRSSDHLSRILFAQFGEIGCWKQTCAIRGLCDHCGTLRPAFDLPVALVAVPAPSRSAASTA